MRSFRLAISLIAVALFASACIISEPKVVQLTNEELAGTYLLRSVNGAALPAIIQQAIGTQPKIEVLSDRLEVHEDGTWSGVQSVRITTGTTVETSTTTSSGTFSSSGSSVSFRDSGDGFVFTVAASGNAFLLSDGSLQYLYTR